MSSQDVTPLLLPALARRSLQEPEADHHADDDIPQATPTSRVSSVLRKVGSVVPKRFSRVAVEHKFGADPVSKWRHYGKFPMKLVLTVIQCLLLWYYIDTQSNRTKINLKHAITYNFFPDSTEILAMEIADSRDLKTYLIQNTKRFHAWQDQLPGIIRHGMKPNSPPKPPVVRDAYGNTCNMTLDHPLGPFGKTTPPNCRRLDIANITDFTIEMEFLTMPATRVAGVGGCPFRKWTILMEYTQETSLFYDVRGWIISTPAFEACSWFSRCWLFIVMGICAVWHLLLQIKRFKKWGKFKQLAREYANRTGSPPPRLGRKWVIWTSLADVTVIALSVCHLASMEHVFHNAGIDFEGIAAFLQWSSLPFYFQYSPNVYTMYGVLDQGLSQMMSLLLASLPLLMAYLLFGVHTFGSYSEFFRTTSDGLATLFSLINGDSVYDVFFGIQEATGWGNMGAGLILSRVFLYTYICLFVYILLNVFLIVTIGAYHSGLEAKEEEDEALNNFISNVTDADLKEEMEKSLRHLDADDRSNSDSESEVMVRHLSSSFIGVETTSIRLTTLRHKRDYKLNAPHIIFHVILCLACTIFTIFHKEKINIYIKDSIELLEETFLADQGDHAWGEDLKKHNTYFFRLEDGLKVMEDSVNRYYTIGDTIPQSFHPIMDPAGHISPVSMKLVLVKDGTMYDFDPRIGREPITITYDCRPETHFISQIRSNNDNASWAHCTYKHEPIHTIPNFKSRLIKAQIAFVVSNHHKSSNQRPMDEESDMCIEWHLDFTLDMSNRDGTGEFKMNSVARGCPSGGNHQDAAFCKFASTVVCASAFIAFCISGWEAWKVLKARLEHSWSRVGQGEALEPPTVTTWQCMFIMSEVVNTIWPIWHAYFLGLPCYQWQFLLTATGCALCWICLWGHMEWNAHIHILGRTVRAAIPRIAKIILGIMPVYVAFALLAVSALGPTTYFFFNLEQAFVTMFALANGDAMYGIIMRSRKGSQEVVYNTIAGVWCYSYIALTICVVLNLFIVTVQSAYAAAQDTVKAEMEEEKEAEASNTPTPGKQPIKESTMSLGL